MIINLRKSPYYRHIFDENRYLLMNEMNFIIPRNFEEYSKNIFWNRRYNYLINEKKELHYDWIYDYDVLRIKLKSIIGDVNKKIVHLGTGSSMIPIELYKDGFESQVGIDYSIEIIDKLNIEYPYIQWLMIDCIEYLNNNNSLIQVVFDKCTLDTILNQETFVSSVYNSLVNNGIYICINNKENLLNFLNKIVPWKSSYIIDNKIHILIK